MKVRFALCLFAVLVSCVSAQSVTITPKKISYNRTGKDISDYKRTFEVTYPVITSKLPKSVRHNIASSLNYWNAFSWRGYRFSLTDEIKRDEWVDELRFEVKYNSKYILAVWLSMDGSGAYPATSIKHLVLNLRTGRRLSINDLFRRDRMVRLRNAIRRVMIRSEHNLGDGEKAELKFQRSMDVYNEYYPGPDRLELKDLDGFTVSDKGVSFLFDYGYAHVVQALQPSGEFFLSYRELRPFIRREGLLGRFVH